MARRNSLSMAICAIAFFFLVLDSTFVQGRLGMEYGGGSSGGSGGGSSGGSSGSHCGSPLAECDFYFHGYENEVPKIKLYKTGDHTYSSIGGIKHKIGGQHKTVRVANSIGCEIKSNGYWYHDRCHHNLYTNGKYVASRTFNINPNAFLGQCIKILIGAAQYSGGGNFNNGANDDSACILVRTEHHFKN